MGSGGCGFPPLVHYNGNPPINALPDKFPWALKLSRREGGGYQEYNQTIRNQHQSSTERIEAAAINQTTEQRIGLTCGLAEDLDGPLPRAVEDLPPALHLQGEAQPLQPRGHLECYQLETTEGRERRLAAKSASG